MSDPSYRRAISNVALAIRGQGTCDTKEPAFNAFDASVYLALAFGKTKEAVLADLLAYKPSETSVTVSMDHEAREIAYRQIPNTRDDRFFTRHTAFTVRLWDHGEGRWIDVRTNVDKKTAIEVWCNETLYGTRNASYSHGDYYEIFPADSTMALR